MPLSRKGLCQLAKYPCERETIKPPEADRIYTVTEGDGITGALCGATECEKNVRKAEAYR